MSKKYIFIACAALLILIGIFSFLRKDEDAWVCKNFTWEKHGNPYLPKPDTACLNK